MSLVTAGLANRSYSFFNGWTARLPSSTTPVQCPAIGKTEQVRFKNHPDSNANAYIGFSSASATTVEGYPLAPGDDTGWIPINKLDTFWYVMDDLTTYVNYMIVRDDS